MLLAIGRLVEPGPKRVAIVRTAEFARSSEHNYDADKDGHKGF